MSIGGGRVTWRHGRRRPCCGGGLQPRRQRGRRCRGRPCSVSRPRSVVARRRAAAAVCSRCAAAGAGARGTAPPCSRSSRWRDGLEPGRALCSPTGRGRIVLLGRRQRPPLCLCAIGRSFRSRPPLTLLLSFHDDVDDDEEEEEEWARAPSGTTRIGVALIKLVTRAARSSAYARLPRQGRAARGSTGTDKRHGSKSSNHRDNQRR